MSSIDNVDMALANERNGYSIFSDDYTPSPEAIAQVNRVFDYIEGNPERWNQYSYGNQDSLTNCFMGILCRINGSTTKYGEYALSQAITYLGMDRVNHWDRARYIAEYLDVRNTPSPGVTYDTYWRGPTLDEMRERVSIAMSHDFRKQDSNNVIISDDGDPLLTN